MIQALKSQGIYESTLFIVTAKHGQSPINPAKVNKPGHFADLVAALPDSTSNAGGIAIAAAAACTTGPCGFVQDDDIALIWLKDQSQTPAVAAYLNANAGALFIDEVLAGDELKLKFNDPANDSRTPDIIVQPVYGTIYTTSTKKNAEHGGFSFGDTNVGLIVSKPGFSLSGGENSCGDIAGCADDPAGWGSIPTRCTRFASSEPRYCPALPNSRGVPRQRAAGTGCIEQPVRNA